MIEEGEYPAALQFLVFNSSLVLRGIVSSIVNCFKSSNLARKIVVVVSSNFFFVDRFVVFVISLIQ